MSAPRHILVNGLCVGSAGIYTVARELVRHLAADRPGWRFTVVITQGHPVQEGLRAENLGENVAFEAAPPDTGRIVPRVRFERAGLPSVANRVGADALLQLNGMVVPSVKLPTLAHFGDPWPYTPAAWTHFRHRLIARVKRRQNRLALRRADCCGFTSGYLRDLVTNSAGYEPARSEVFYNGVPRAWIDRAGSDLPPHDDRPMEIVSVSNVSPYKRQGLVIDALPRLIGETGLTDLLYRIIGQCDEAYCAELRAKIERLKLGRHVRIEGRVSDEAVAAAYRSARAFVLPSVCESFCIPAVEAMSFGTPVVVAAAAALPEIVGSAGELCEPDDADDLAERLHRVLTDAPHRESLRRRGAGRVGRYDWAISAAAMARELEAMTDRAAVKTLF